MKHKKPKPVSRNLAYVFKNDAYEKIRQITLMVYSDLAGSREEMAGTADQIVNLIDRLIGAPDTLEGALREDFAGLSRAMSILKKDTCLSLT